MKRNLLGLGLFASLVLSSTTWAQVAVPVVPVAPIAAPAAPGNLWSFLLPNKEQCSHVKTVFCESGIGQMVNGLSGPFSLMSGGLIKNRCLKNSILNDLKKPADTPEGAAARVAADAEAAKARRDSVRALGLVDCNYWPEAIEVLTVSLRGDRSECVRFEAALALRNGCCCNKATVKALEMSVSGSNADGFPAERSERVRAVAGEALAMCPIIETEVEKTKDKLTRNMLPPNVNPGDYYKKVALMSNEQIAASARATLSNVRQASKTQAEATPSTSAVAAAPIVHQRAGSLAGIVSHAFNGSTDPQVRAPFFSGLTRSLTGKQENMMQHYIMPAPTNTAVLPEIHTIPTTEIVPPTPGADMIPPSRTKVESGPPSRLKPNLPAVEIVPSQEFMNPPRDKKVTTPRDMRLPTETNNNTTSSLGRPMDAKSGENYIKVSPHVRQLQPVAAKPAVVGVIETTPIVPEVRPMPVSLPVATPVVQPAAPAKAHPIVPETPFPPTILQATHIPVRNTPPAKALVPAIPVSPKMPAIIPHGNEIPARSAPTANTSYPTSATTPKAIAYPVGNEIPARSAPVANPAYITIPVTQRTTPMIPQGNEIPAQTPPTSNLTVVNTPPMGAMPTPAPIGQVRESRPSLPPEILQNNTQQPQDTRGAVTIEFGPR